MSLWIPVVASTRVPGLIREVRDFTKVEPRQYGFLAWGFAPRPRRIDGSKDDIVGILVKPGDVGQTYSDANVALANSSGGIEGRMKREPHRDGPVKVDIIHFHDRRDQVVKRIGLICGALLAVTAVTAGAQQRLVQVGGHAGVLDDGRGFAGGQVAVRILPRIVGYFTGSTRTESAPGNFEIYEAGLRPILLSGPVSPYVLGGLTLEHISSPFPSGNVTEEDLGFHFGAGVEAGQGWLRPFVEARGYKAGGGVVGVFWGGVRVGFGK